MGLKPEDAEEAEEECWEERWDDWECWEGEKRLAQLSSRLSSSRNSSESRLAFMPLLCCAVLCTEVGGRTAGGGCWWKQ